MNSEGTGQTNLSNNDFDEGNVSWLPDGKKLTFVSNRSGHYQIYVMNSDGTNQTNISNNKYDD